MSDIEKFITARKTKSPKAWAGFEQKYEEYALGLQLAELREKAGLSLTELARRTKMHKTSLSRLENHGEDALLSTIRRYVEATGHPLQIAISPGKKHRGMLTSHVVLHTA
jgi:DNA-binding XRE family transcriptional regulator